ncbi:serine hydrolase domain-containing protein [Streptomyces griseofuscus]|uniref:serine hydrolase domain-containing protein n=1 Tax=Streptomyces griseofuscus TaxID=146922 RepID=UPI00340BDC2B
MTGPSNPSIEGTWDPKFAHLRDVFEENFRERGEIGAAVCVYQDGEKVVDLWGGVADPATGRAWGADTIVGMMSIGKSMAAVCVLILADRGRLDLDKPVAAYWPEFAQGGKADITVRTLMQSKAGLLYADAAPDGAGFDWDTMIRAFEIQEPEWEPGTMGGYHSMSMGFLLGELVRRVDGRRLEDFFDDEVAGPLGVDYRFGLRRADFARTAKIIAAADVETINQMLTPGTNLNRSWRIRPRPATMDPNNDPDYLMARFPSSNGQGNARAVARVYALLAGFGELDGVRLMSRELVEVARTESWANVCPSLGTHQRYGCGFLLPSDAGYPWPNPKAFGHPGLGGAIGVADPEARLSFSYSPNRLATDLTGVGDRCAALIDALWSKND